MNAIRLGGLAFSPTILIMGLMHGETEGGRGGGERGRGREIDRDGGRDRERVREEGRKRAKFLYYHRLQDVSVYVRHVLLVYSRSSFLFFPLFLRLKGGLFYHASLRLGIHSLLEI